MRLFISIGFGFTLGFLLCLLLTYDPAFPRVYVLNLSELLSKEESRVLKSKDDRGMFYGSKNTPNLLPVIIKELEAKYDTKIYEAGNTEEVTDVTGEVYELLLKRAAKKPAAKKEKEEDQAEQQKLGQQKAEQPEEQIEKAERAEEEEAENLDQEEQAESEKKEKGEKSA